MKMNLKFKQLSLINIIHVKAAANLQVTKLHRIKQLLANQNTQQYIHHLDL